MKKFNEIKSNVSINFDIKNYMKLYSINYNFQKFTKNNK